MQIYGIDISNKHLDLYSEDQTGKPVVKRISNKLKPIVKFIYSIPKDSTICAEHTGVYGNLLGSMSSFLDTSTSIVMIDMLWIL